MPTAQPTDSERLARLEVEVEGMRAQFGGRFNALESKIDVLTNAVSDSRKPRWDTWAAWLAVAITLIGGGAWAIDRRFGDQEARADRSYAALQTLSQSVAARDAASHEKLAEIETQFKLGSQVYNQIDHRQMVLIDQLWRQQFKQALMDDSPWPIMGKER